MQQRHLNRQTYFNELANTSQEFYIGYLRKHIQLKPETNILEIGCGEGGNLLPFARQGCKVTGIDRAKSRIEQAKEFFHSARCEGTFIATDFLDMKAEEYGKFDLILIHDVIEHVPDKKRFIQHIRQFLTPDSLIFWGFPAWQMPFGGHQQICRSRFVSHLPFIHLLPSPVYRTLIQSCGIDSSELMEIKQCKVTIEAFERLMKENDYVVIDRVLWFINPHYKQKFRLNPRKLYPWMAHFKYVRNFFSTSCFYLTAMR
ncbi:class I SAM-dependent methyltransferase [Phocaeicola sp.]